PLDIVKSIGHQITLPRDYTKVEDIQIVLLELAEAICRRTRMGNYVGRTVSRSVRGNDFHGIHRSKTLKESTAYPQIVYNTSLKLFNQYWKEKEPVRLLGLALSKLSHLKNKQLCFFNEDEKLYNAIDQIKDKFGEKSLLRSSFLLEGGVFYGGNRQQDVGRSPNYLP
ncbi:MAG: DNA polymerase IV, partial [Clostridia bacterium]|nr:DNA polymerase IV [Clostridia bacterium]